MIHAFILQITSCNSADVASQYSNELGEILRDSFDYSEEKAMKHLLDSGLLMFYFQVKSHSFKNPAQLASVESVNQLGLCNYHLFEFGRLSVGYLKNRLVIGRLCI